MTVVQELFETYDPLEKAPTLTLYMLKDGEEWARISSDEPVIGTQLTRLLQMSQDSRPILKRLVSNGERLTYHVKKQGSPWKAYSIVPSDWVVTKVVQYEPFSLGELPEFRGVTIAYCERQPLSPEEIEAMTRETISKVSVDSFGPNEEAYQRFLASEPSKEYVQTESGHHSQ